MPRRRLLTTTPLIALAIVAAGCAEIGRSTSPGTTRATVAPAASAVPLDIRQGPEGSTLALVPVTINGEGPFPFALDTGASSSVIDREIVKRLGLPLTGEPMPVTGVAGRTQARRVQVDSLQAGGVALPTGNIGTIDLPDPDRAVGVDGLLGSDILSRFGSVVVDYEAGVLRLGAGAPAAGG